MICECLPEYCYFINCSIRQINRTLAVINFNHMLKTEISNVEVSVYVTLLFSWYIIIYRNVFLNLNSTYLIVYYPKKMYKNVYSSFDFCFLNLFVDCFRWTFRHHCQIFLFILDKNLSNKWRIVNYIHISWINWITVKCISWHKIVIGCTEQLSAFIPG